MQELRPFIVILVALTVVVFRPARAQKYDPGASDTEIRIGSFAPYSGPTAPLFSWFGRTLTAYFNKINAEGGVNGRKIKFISYDDGYDPKHTPEVVRRLVEDDKVLLIGGPLGSPTNAAVQRYLNDKKVPQLFVISGNSQWDDPNRFPWSMGWQPSYPAEARIYAQYLLESRPSGRIGVLYQNDEVGKDYLKGLKDGLGGKMPIVAEVPYDILADPSLDAPMTRLKASGADILFTAAIGKAPMEAINKVSALRWKPLHIVSSNAFIKPVGVEGAEGLLSTAYLKDAADPTWNNDPGFREWAAFMRQYLPDGGNATIQIAYAYGIAQTLVQVLRQCGDDLTRENIMRQAANLKNIQLGVVQPGIVLNTSTSDFAPIEQMRMMRFDGQRWQPFGPVRSGVDPGAVSEGLKAVFRYGSATRETADRLNSNTVTIVTGTLGSTYEIFGADMASALDDGDNLRILPVIGRGSVQGVADILFLKGVDAGIVRTDTLDYLEERGFSANIKKQFAYVTKLFYEEMHVIAPRSIQRFADLEGRTVAVDLPNGGTFITAINVFERLGIRPHFVYLEPRVAFERLRRGEIDAVIGVEGKPVPWMTHIADQDLHFVPIEYGKPLQDRYLPSELTDDEYPNLIRRGSRVDTIAVAAVLAAYNWPSGSDRYRRLAHFVDVLFSRLGALQQPPFHPRWRDVGINAPLPGWVRFQAAQDWLDQHWERQPSAADHDQALFRTFLQWQQQRESQRPPQAR
jgi:ABC-type branched-subunit amino acid transport system substrate-binding protein/TRAP-type uncharacterized transport system substrate-binding protein